MGIRRDGMEVTSPYGENGMLEDWEAVEAIWEHALKKRLALQTDEHPVLLSEPVHNSDAVRAKMVELMFEKHAPPALFLAKSPVLSSFAVGQGDELGDRHGREADDSVSAVHDGFALCKSPSCARRSAAKRLTDVVLKYLEKQKVDVRPRYAFTKKVRRATDEFRRQGR